MYAQAENLVQDEGFKRKLVWSFLGHIVLLALLWFSPNPSLILAPPTAVYIDVVSAPEVAPAPPPAPPKQVVEEVVIPKELPKPKPKAEAPKPKPKPKPEPKPAAKPEKKPSAEDLLSQLRQKVESRQTANAATATGTRGVFDPEKAAYTKKLTALLYANWAGSGICRQDPRPSNFRIDVAADGKVRSIVRTASSGNRFCDESAERAIRKVDPLPRPPRGIKTVTITFDPLEVR